MPRESDSDVSTPIGTPDAPALKPHPRLFAISLLAFIVFMSMLANWAIQLRHR